MLWWLVLGGGALVGSRLAVPCLRRWRGRAVVITRLPTGGGEAHVCLAATASSSSPVSTSHQTQPVVDETHLARLLVGVSVLSQHSLARKSKSSRPRALKRRHLAIFTAINNTTTTTVPLLLTTAQSHHSVTTTTTTATTTTTISPLVSSSVSLPNRNRHLTIALLIRSGRSFLRCVSPTSPAFLA